ncbi:universal stress protein [Saccharopolyspora rosea]|uniref:Universal stress protein n=1 Tax=Saccharopolyspora rosea TaxID=524884 RepID=A0ABW3FSE1_9PSEU|nr:universal stress protein [Saccharopolyspora rosea]
MAATGGGSGPVGGAVVVGYDGTGESAKAVRWAAAEATTRGRPLVVVWALAVPLEKLSRVHPSSGEVTFTALRADALREIDEVVSDIRSTGLDVRADARLGHPARVLLDASADAALLVLGSPQPSKIRRILVGSTAAELIRRAQVPVVAVRSDDASPPSRVVVGVDGSAHSERAIGFALDAAERHGAELTALLVAEEPYPDALPPVRGWRLPSDDVDAARRELAEVLAGRQENHPGVTAHQRVVTDERPAQALVAAGADADLLVVGTRGRGVVRTTFLGSVSHAVVHYAPCTVAVVR